MERLRWPNREQNLTWPIITVKIKLRVVLVPFRKRKIIKVFWHKELRCKKDGREKNQIKQKRI